MNAMKISRWARLLACLLCVALLLPLAACGGKKAASQEEDAAPASGPDTSGLGVDLSTGEWTGQGGSYVLDPADSPAGGDGAVLQLFSWEGELCSLYSEDYDRYEIRRGGETAFVLEHFAQHYPNCCAVAEEGLWVCENTWDERGKNTYTFDLYSAQGELLDSQCPDASMSMPLSMGIDGDLLYIATLDGDLLAYGKDWTLAGSSPIGENEFLIRAGDGHLYAGADEGAAGVSVYALSPEGIGPEPLFTCPAGKLFSGGCGYFLLLKTDEGLFSLTADGTVDPVVIWAECALSAASIGSLRPLEDGSFLCENVSGWNLLRPAGSGEIHPRTRLTVAELGSGINMRIGIEAFNAANRDWVVDVVDYTENGNLDRDAALMRLNTDLTAGDAPDMISFWDLSPVNYARKGLLVDQTELFEAGGEVSVEDLALLQVLERYGGLYVLGSSFLVSTVAGRQSVFGDRMGWTVEEYLTMDRQREDGTEMLYNATRDLFIQDILEPYVWQAIDWETASCQVETPDFVTLLEATANMRETPEDPNNIDFTPGPVRVANGSLIGTGLYITAVDELSQALRSANCPLSYIGWPTADGSCSTKVDVNPKIGIVTGGKHIDGCWAFVKFLLTEQSESTWGLPLYRPALEQVLEKAWSDPEKPLLTREEAEDFRRLLDAVTLDMYADETVTSILREECQRLFAGVKSPEETASVIQSRVNIYLAEQYG